MFCTLRRKLFGEDPGLWRGGSGRGDKDGILQELAKQTPLSGALLCISDFAVLL